MAYVRGHRLCFRRGQRAAGDDWSYDALLPVLQASRGQLARRVGLSRRRRSAGGGGHDRSARRPPGVPRSRARARLRGAPRLRFRRRPAGAGRRLLSEEHPRRPPAFGGRRVSGARARAPEPHRVVATRRRFASRFRARAPRVWRCCAPARACTRARSARGHPRRRRHRVAEAADAVRHRPRGRAAARSASRWSLDLARRRRAICRITCASQCAGRRAAACRRPRCRQVCSRSRRARPRDARPRRRTSSSMWAAASTCPIHSSR